MKLTSALGLTLVLLLVLSLIIPEVIILNKITHIITITILTHDNVIKGGVKVNPTSQRSSRKSWKGRRRQRHQVFFILTMIIILMILTLIFGCQGKAPAFKEGSKGGKEVQEISEGEKRKEARWDIFLSPKSPLIISFASCLLACVHFECGSNKKVGFHDSIFLPLTVIVNWVNLHLY